MHIHTYNSYFFKSFKICFHNFLKISSTKDLNHFPLYLCQQNQISGGGCMLHSPGEDSIISNSRRLETFMGGKTNSNLPSPATSLTHYSTDTSNELAAIPTTTTTITNNTISTTTTTTTTTTTNHTPTSTPPTTATGNYSTSATIGQKDGKVCIVVMKLLSARCLVGWWLLCLRILID